MPYKYNESRRHHFKKHTYRQTNYAEYNQSLRDRGRIDIYHQYLNDLPVDGFQKNYLEAERFATTDRVYRRAVKELETKGFIVKDNHGFRILDLEALREFVEE